MYKIRFNTRNNDERFCSGVTLQKLVKKESVNVFSKEEQELVIKSLDTRNIVDALINRSKAWRSFRATMERYKRKYD